MINKKIQQNGTISIPIWFCNLVRSLAIYNRLEDTEFELQTHLMNKWTRFEC